ncbi:MAG: pyridoxamine 5'-phosphate oxidase family protein [Pseudonocardia sp.]|nr:pyridoxamine 5'-phosphate oxidase family protein [Pseudonocardia sp.]MBO0877103.1 pyridoxamine 5'-phosphate oxidase family protein [Pseudonocardia sp.]
MPTTDIDTLSERDCLTLLGTVDLGRLLFTENALPAIRPVNFTITDGRIVIPATEGSWADRLHGVLVAFVVDEINSETNTGWAVLVHGTAHLVTHPQRVLTVGVERVAGQHLALTRPAPLAL